MALTAGTSLGHDDVTLPPRGGGMDWFGHATEADTRVFAPFILQEHLHELSSHTRIPGQTGLR